MNCINVAQLNSGPQSVANIHTVASLYIYAIIHTFSQDMIIVPSL